MLKTVDDLDYLFLKWEHVNAEDTSLWRSAWYSMDFKRDLGIDKFYECIEKYYRIDLLRKAAMLPSQLEMQKDLSVVLGDKNKKYFFVTIGFDDNIITPEMINRAVKVLHEIPQIKINRFVVEKFRKSLDGEIYKHHHIHMLVSTDCFKTKVIQYIFQKLSSKKFSVIAGKNFIDVKNTLSYDKYDQYILGNKQDSKLELLSMDKEWRKTNNIIEYK